MIRISKAAGLIAFSVAASAAPAMACAGDVASAWNVGFLMIPLIALMLVGAALTRAIRMGLSALSRAREMGYRIRPAQPELSAPPAEPLERPSRSPERTLVLR